MYRLFLIYQWKVKKKMKSALLSFHPFGSVTSGLWLSESYWSSVALAVPARISQSWDINLLKVFCFTGEQDKMGQKPSGLEVNMASTFANPADYSALKGFILTNKH